MAKMARKMRTRVFIAALALTLMGVSALAAEPAAKLETRPEAKPTTRPETEFDPEAKAKLEELEAENRDFLL
jgi:hypothetical protein